AVGVVDEEAAVVFGMAGHAQQPSLAVDGGAVADVQDEIADSAVEAVHPPRPLGEQGDIVARAGGEDDREVGLGHGFVAERPEGRLRRGGLGGGGLGGGGGRRSGGRRRVGDRGRGGSGGGRHGGGRARRRGGLDDRPGGAGRHRHGEGDRRPPALHHTATLGPPGRNTARYAARQWRLTRT